MKEDVGFWDKLLVADGCTEKQREILQRVAARNADGTLALNNVQFIYPGGTYRDLSAKLAGAGIVNDKGTPFHPNHLRLEFIDAIARNSYILADYDGEDREALARLRKEIARAIRRKQPYRKQ
jgi:hypothetical protein